MQGNTPGLDRSAAACATSWVEKTRSRRSPQHTTETPCETPTECWIPAQPRDGQTAARMPPPSPRPADPPAAQQHITSNNARQTSPACDRNLPSPTSDSLAIPPTSDSKPHYVSEQPKTPPNIPSPSTRPHLRTLTEVALQPLPRPHQLPRLRSVILDSCPCYWSTTTSDARPTRGGAVRGWWNPSEACSVRRSAPTVAHLRLRRRALPDRGDSTPEGVAPRCPNALDSDGVLLREVEQSGSPFSRRG